MVASFHPNQVLLKGNGRTLGSQRVLFGPDTGQPGLSNIRWQERVASGSDGWRDLELDSPVGEIIPADVLGIMESPAGQDAILAGLDAAEPAEVGEQVARAAYALPDIIGAVVRRCDVREKDRISVREFGAIGDGVTDDTPAFQAGIAALKLSTAPVKTLFVPGVETFYKIGTWVDFRGIDGMVIEGEGRRSLLKATTANRAPIGTHQVSQTLPQSEPVYTLTGILRPGQRTATLLTEADSANLAVDDWVFVRCGILTADVPICELNQILGIAGAVITFRFAFAGTYRKMGDDTAFGVSKVNAHCCHNLILRNLALQSDTCRASYMWFGYGNRVENVHCIGHGGIVMRGRNLFVDSTVDLTPNWTSGFTAHALGFDCGTTDVTARVHGHSRGAASIHLHEDCRDIDLELDLSRGNVNTGTVVPWPVVSIVGQSRNIRIRKARIHNSYKNGSAVFGAITSVTGAVYLTFGHEGLRIDDLAITGVITNDTNDARAFSHSGNLQPVLLGSLRTTGAKLDNPLSIGSGEIWSQEKLSRELPYAAGAAANGKLTLGAASPGVEATADGETVIEMADGATSGGQFEVDVLRGAGYWTRAIALFEVENADGTANGNGRFSLDFKSNTSSTALDFTTGTTNSLVTQSFHKAGSPRLVGQAVALGATAVRVGFRLHRVGADALDTLDGAKLRIRKAWLHLLR